MDAAAIGSAYDSLAERWLDGRFDQFNGVSQHEQALAFLGRRNAGWALNVGCGCNTRFNASMRAHGLRIEGVDVSERMIALARAAAPGVVLHHADICAWSPPRTYDFISAWDSIWHVRLELQRGLMKKLMAVLTPGGVFTFSAGALAQPDEHVDTAMGPALYYGTLGIPDLLEVIDEAGCICRHLEYDQFPLEHLFVIAQRP